MKIISLIASYNPQNIYINTVITELKKISDVILFTTDKHQLNVDESYYFEKSIGRALVYKPREWILNNISKNWDYVIYNEDDILLPATSILNAINLYKELPDEFIPGFIRYELDDRDNTKRYFDMNPVHAIHRNSYGTIKEKWDKYKIWEPWNLHSGNWIFSKNDIINMINSDVFETSYMQKNYKYGNCDELESAASVPYLFYKKVFPYNVETVECLHIPKKYIYLDNNNPSLENLQELIYD